MGYLRAGRISFGFYWLICRVATPSARDHLMVSAVLKTKEANKVKRQKIGGAFAIEKEKARGAFPVSEGISAPVSPLSLLPVFPVFLF